MNKNRSIYLVFMSTGTMLSRAIDLYTKTGLNHVSIALDEGLTEVYSFGRKRPYNPFIGGFVREDMASAFFNHSQCAIYRLEIDVHQYDMLKQNIAVIEATKHLYRYNFLGLFGVMLNYELERDHAYFCSQFVSTMLSSIGIKPNDKPAGLMRPDDLRSWDQLSLVYSGPITDYLGIETEQSMLSRAYSRIRLRLF